MARDVPLLLVGVCWAVLATRRLLQPSHVWTLRKPRVLRASGSWRPRGRGTVLERSTWRRHGALQGTGLGEPGDSGGSCLRHGSFFPPLDFKNFTQNFSCLSQL